MSDAVPSPRDFRDLLRRDPWFASLPVGLAQAVLDAAVVRRYCDREAVFVRAAPPCGLYAVLEGAVRISTATETGKEALLTIFEPVTWFGEISLFDGLPRSHDALSHGHLTALHIDQARMRAILGESGENWRMLGVLMGFKLRMTLAGVEDTALYPAALRLMRRIVLMMDSAVGVTDVHGVRQIAIQQEQLALMLSLSRQTVNQILKDLEARGAIRLAYGRIDILQPRKLRELARVTGLQHGMRPQIAPSVPVGERRKKPR